MKETIFWELTTALPSLVLVWWFSSRVMIFRTHHNESSSDYSHTRKSDVCGREANKTLLSLCATNVWYVRLVVSHSCAQSRVFLGDQRTRQSCLCVRQKSNVSHSLCRTRCVGLVVSDSYAHSRVFVRDKSLTCETRCVTLVCTPTLESLRGTKV